MTARAKPENKRPILTALFVCVNLLLGIIFTYFIFKLFLLAYAPYDITKITDYGTYNYSENIDLRSGELHDYIYNSIVTFYVIVLLNFFIYHFNRFISYKKKHSSVLIPSKLNETDLKPLPSAPDKIIDEKSWLVFWRDVASSVVGGLILLMISAVIFGQKA